MTAATSKRTSTSVPSHHKPRAPRRPVVAVLPPPPATMTAAAAAEWRRIGPRLVTLGMVPDLDRTLFTLYCSSVGDLEDVRQAWLSEGAPATVERPSGAREHPTILTLRQLGADAARYATALGLSPRSRRTLGVDLGNPAPIVPVAAETVDDEISRRYFDD